VRLAGAVVPGRHQALELTTHHRELLVGRRLAELLGGLGLVGCSPRRSLCRLQQVTDLVGLQQAGDPEEVHLLLGTHLHLAGMAELGSVVEHAGEGRM